MAHLHGSRPKFVTLNVAVDSLHALKKKKNMRNLPREASKGKAYHTVQNNLPQAIFCTVWLDISQITWECIAIFSLIKYRTKQNNFWFPHQDFVRCYLATLMPFLECR